MFNSTIDGDKEDDDLAKRSGFSLRRNISANSTASTTPKTAGMSSPNTSGSPQPPRSVFDIQFGSIPVLRPRSNSAPVSSPEEARVNQAVISRRGSLSRPPNFTPVSTYTSLPASESLIHYRIDLLNDNEASSLPSITLLKMEIDPNSGELYGDDVTPPAKTKDPKPVISRDMQRWNVAYRQYQRNMKQTYGLSDAAEFLRNKVIQRTDLRLAVENARIDRAEQAKAIATRETQAQADIARAASGDLSDEQKASRDLQARIQRRSEAKEATRQRELAENAALLNNPALIGLGLTLNPDFITANNSEGDPEKEDNDATIAELETIDPIRLDLSSIPTLTLPPSTFTSVDPSHRIPTPNLIPILSPTLPTASLTLASPRTGYQSPPEEPVKRAQEALTRVSNGQTTRVRSVVEGLRDVMRGATQGERPAEGGEEE